MTTLLFPINHQGFLSSSHLLCVAPPPIGKHQDRLIDRNAPSSRAESQSDRRLHGSIRVSVVALHSGIRSHPSAKVLTSIQNA